MNIEPRSLDLFIPGLLGRFPWSGTPGLPEPHSPALEKLLARARRPPASTIVDEAPFSLFGYALPAAQDRPDAWLSYRADTGRFAERAVLRADPVHLRADQHRLVLFDALQARITAPEAADLIEAFNALYGDDGLRLEAPMASRWYLHLPEWPRVQTTPLAVARGRDIDSTLPKGPDAPYWHRLMNEVQMLFHGQAVNRDREALGRPTINSLWFWGAGEPVQARPQTWRQVWTEDAVVVGLAELNGIASASVPSNASDWLAQASAGRHLLTNDELQQSAAYADLEGWSAGVARFEEEWFAPLLRALRSGLVQEVRLYPGDGRLYAVRGGDLWRVWRRPRPLWN